MVGGLTSDDPGEESGDDLSEARLPFDRSTQMKVSRSLYHDC